MVNEPGSFIGAKRDRLVVKRGGNVVVEIAASQLSCVYIATRGSTLSCSAMRLLLRNHVNVVVLDGSGRPVGRLMPFIKRGLRTVEEQISAVRDERGTRLAKSFAVAKVTNQANLLRSLSYNRRTSSLNLADELYDLSIKVRRNVKPIQELAGDLAAIRQEVVRLEAEAAEIYWSGIASVLREMGIDFPGRKKRFENPDDPMNMVLNYGYGILATRCTLSLELAGLDPFRGFLHVNSPRRPSLAMDVMEEFRQSVVDRAALKVLRENGKEIVKGRELKREARKTVLQAVTERFRQKVTFRDRSLPIEHHILLQARRIAVYLLRKSEEYHGFVER
ncbi:MAG: CRISPR-associated endonuclease Cas1 [Thaumarchaeota archaeon]|nr:CRISPR-associated endonuclease Cas1 [Candidatus Calditenuaceae archaeon]